MATSKQDGEALHVQLIKKGGTDPMQARRKDTRDPQDSLAVMMEGWRNQVLRRRCRSGGRRRLD